MAIYILMIIWCLVTQYISEHAKYCRKIYALFPIIIIFAVSALRYNVGTDYGGTYMGAYYAILYGGDAKLEYIPTLIYDFIIHFELDPQWFFAITSLFFCYFVYKSIEYQSTNKALSYYIVICGTLLFFSYNGIRQALAMVSFYYSLTWMTNNKNNIRYLLNNIVSVGFHYSGAVFLPLFLFLEKKYKFKTKIIVLTVISILSIIALPVIVNLISKTKFSYYIANQEMFQKTALNLSNYMNLVFWMLYEYLCNKKEKPTQKDIIYGNVHYIGVIVSLFTLTVPLAYRLFYAFRYIEYLSIPNLLSNCKTKYKYILILISYIYYFVYFAYMILFQHAHDSLPYLSIFDR